jgi:hypothetical protein
MEFLTSIVDTLRDAGIRTSIFVDTDVDNIKLAAKTGADRVELFTKPYADLYPTNPEEAVAPYIVASQAAHKAGLGVNAGHDLSLENLEYFHKQVPYLNEVSIGHSLISDAIYLRRFLQTKRKDGLALIGEFLDLHDLIRTQCPRKEDYHISDDIFFLLTESAEHPNDDIVLPIKLIKSYSN